MNEPSTNAERLPNDRAGDVPTLSTLWLADAQAMDSGAWSRLAETFGPIVYRWCRKSGISDSESADVVQDVFVAVARNIGRFERKQKEGSFRSWLATITRNRIRDHYRRRANYQPAEGGSDALQRLQQHRDEVDQSVSEDSIGSPRIQKALMQVRDEFEEATWEAFWLVTVERKPTSVVAELVGISVASVYQAKSRVLRKLREVLADEGE